MRALPRRLDELALDSEISSMPFWKFLERVTYAVDIAASLQSFFEVYPDAARIFTLENVAPRYAPQRLAKLIVRQQLIGLLK